MDNSIDHNSMQSLDRDEIMIRSWRNMDPAEPISQATLRILN
jgi:hypothetical protein